MVAIIDYRGKSPRKTSAGIPLVTAKVVKGGRIETPDEFIDPAEYDEWMRRGLPQAGDVLITTEAPLGEVAILDGRKVALAQRLICLRANQALLDCTFLKFMMQSPSVQDQLRARATGTTVSGIRQSELRKVRLLLPPLREQAAIANLLGALDEKLEVNRQISETLEAMGRDLFRSWFVDFAPIATTDGRVQGLVDARVNDLFPREIDPRSRAPRGWSRRSLGEWVEALSGGTPSKGDPSLWDGDIAWISPKVMTEIHADAADEYVTAAAIGNGTRLAPSGSTLVMVRGMGLHKCVRVSQARGPVTFNQDVKALVPRGIEPSLLLFALLNGQQELLGKVESSGHGTGKLPSEILFSHSIVMPPPEIQAKLARTFDLLGDRIASARNESRTLAALRDVLLPGLISGELRIRDVARQIEAVA